MILPSLVFSGLVWGTVALVAVVFSYVLYSVISETRDATTH